MNILTIVFLAVVLLTAIISYKRGFAKMLASFLAVILSAVIIAMISPFLQDLLREKTGIEATLNAKFEEGVSAVLKEKTAIDLSEENVLPDSIIAGLEDRVSGVVTEKAREIAHFLVDIVINAIVYVGGYIAVFIILKLILHGFKLATKLPVLREMNGIAGMLLGLGELLLLVWVAMLLITALVRTDTGASLLRQITESPVLSFIYDHNPILQKVMY